MKIKVEPQKRCKAIQCLEDGCLWRKVCANHVSAGDFRSEDGTMPFLRLIDGVVHCDTIHEKGDGYDYHEEPLHHAGRGMVLWTDLEEERDAYEI